jgi:hypothetical protein
MLLFSKSTCAQFNKAAIATTTTVSGSWLREPSNEGRAPGPRGRVSNDDLLAMLDEALSIDCGLELEEGGKTY